MIGIKTPSRQSDLRLAGRALGAGLAGQRYEYLVEAMRRFADGERANSADMTNIMKAMAPAERFLNRCELRPET